MPSARLCVFNVHSWLDASGRTRIDDTLALLQPLACDLVFLNEVPQDLAIERVAHALGMQLAYGPAQWAGNAILSRAPLSDVRNVALPAFDAEVRAVVMARTTIAGQALTVACTHLDHVRERARLEQLAKLRTVVGGRACIIAGDFNALRSSDYPPVRLEAIREHRAENLVEEPRDDVVARMDAWGFVDAARLADSDAYLSALARPIAPSLRSTCWAGTRIDYAWLSGSLAKRVTRAHAEVIATDVSDHRPLVVTLELTA